MIARITQLIASEKLSSKECFCDDLCCDDNPNGSSSSILANSTLPPSHSPSNSTLHSQHISPLSPMTKYARAAAQKFELQILWTLQLLAKPLCRNVSGIFVLQMLEDSAGDFLEDFSGHFPTNMWRKSRRQNPRPYLAAPTNSKHSFCQEPAPTTAEKWGSNARRTIVLPLLLL